MRWQNTKTISIFITKEKLQDEIGSNACLESCAKKSDIDTMKETFDTEMTILILIDWVDGEQSLKSIR